MEKITLNVDGMSCGNCVKSVETSVGNLAGVNNVEVALEAGTVTVEFNPENITEKTIKNEIEEQGYDVKN